jgi:hypothetical protein
VAEQLAVYEVTVVLTGDRTVRKPLRIKAVDRAGNIGERLSVGKFGATTRKLLKLGFPQEEKGAHCGSGGDYQQ